MANGKTGNCFAEIPSAVRRKPKIRGSHKRGEREADARELFGLRLTIRLSKPKCWSKCLAQNLNAEIAEHRRSFSALFARSAFKVFWFEFRLRRRFFKRSLGKRP
jgi:hypothetical protein